MLPRSHYVLKNMPGRMDTALRVDVGPGLELAKTLSEPHLRNTRCVTFASQEIEDSSLVSFCQFGILSASFFLLEPAVSTSEASVPGLKNWNGLTHLTTHPQSVPLLEHTRTNHSLFQGSSFESVGGDSGQPRPTTILAPPTLVVKIPSYFSIIKIQASLAVKTRAF
ncbi:hypothetical protein DPMN_085117 [Dreissena polymorpha]|uniref:Uncharacterized protein n=1 Tax=Dreissena polymorpha TaxID=45954 RepID=A0A9D4BJY0_DREPO|nr:hypothetical protein DPMN_085117 [Dreissena polymorpha]